MATAEQLKALRKKYGLGEFKRKAPASRKAPAKRKSPAKRTPSEKAYCENTWPTTDSQSLAYCEKCPEYCAGSPGF